MGGVRTYASEQCTSSSPVIVLAGARRWDMIGGGDQGPTPTAVKATGREDGETGRAQRWQQTRKES